MSLNCSSCHEKFKPRQFRISCGICLNSHHRICLPSKIPQKDWTLFKKNWKCISCSSHTSSIPQHVLQNLPFFIDPRVEEESTTINFPDDANIGEKSSSFYNIDIDVQLVLDIVLSNIDKAEIPEFYNGLRIGHLNCNSLAGKIDEIRSFLPKTNFSICCFTETKLDSNVPDSFISISDYNMIRSDRLSRGGGGSIIYLHSAIKYLPLSYEVNFPKEVEVNCVQIFPKFRKPLIIVLIYRPPLDSLKSQFIRSLECLLFQIEKDKVDYMLLGDWNMDLMKYDNHTVSLNSVTRSFALKQLIDVPTRVTSSSSTLIDHIYTNCPQKFIQSGAFDLTTSDHRFTFTILATKKVKVPPRIVTYRPKKNVDWENVGTRINNLDWSELDSKYSVDVNLNYFHTSILNILDEECPSKKKRIKGDSAAWMNDDILNLIDKRVGLKATCAKDPSPENFKIYRKFKNYVSNQVQKAKRNFFITNFDNTCDSNHIWRTYDKLTGKNVKFSLDIPVLVEGDNIITDNVEKVNLLSNSFIINDNSSLEERENLLQNLKIMSNDETVPASQAVIDDELVYMQSSISKCLHKMKWKNSPNDVIPVLALKNLAPHILLPLSLLFIQFFNACEFPSYFKKAIVIPLYKGKGKISDPENYRPISMLPNLSKLFEYCVNNKLMNHVESNNLLEDNQHGFRSGRSCATVLTLFTSKVFQELDKPNNNIIVVFFDLKKAFNSILHVPLINELLLTFKLNVKLVTLIMNFLTNRQISVKLGYFVSDPYAENRGIGQGTVNGPALFICFFDKVKNVLYDCWHSLFADDLSLYISDTDANYGIKRMQVILERLDAWCTSVGLCMSYEKTKLMVIRKKCNNSPILSNITCNGHVIERVSTFKYLDVHIDENFTFKVHAEKVLSKVSKHAGVICKMRRMLTPHMLTLLVNVYINSVTDYCLTVWGPSRINDFAQIKKVTNNLLAMFYFPTIVKYKKKRFWCNLSSNELLKAKKECVQAHKNIDYYRLLEKCNLLTISERLQFYSLWNLFKTRKFGSKVIQFNDLFASIFKERASNSRNPNTCIVLSHKSKLFEYSTLYYSSSLWNSLPRDLMSEKVIVEIPCAYFKAYVHKWLLEKITDEFVYN